MITVIDFTTETQRRTIDQAMTLVTRIFSDFRSFDACIAAMAQGTIIVPNETAIGKLLGTHLTAETFRMPAGLHRFDDTTDDDVATLVAEWRIKCAKITLTILATLELVEDAILKCSEALSAAEVRRRYEGCKISQKADRGLDTYTKH